MTAKLLPTILRLALTCVLILPGIASAQSPTPSSVKKPNILVIFGDDIGQTNVSAYSMGVMGYRTPNIDRIAKEGMIFTDYYAEQSCTEGRASFITGQSGLRTGMTKVASPARRSVCRKKIRRLPRCSRRAASHRANRQEPSG